jgi:hypothetical protein
MQLTNMLLLFVATSGVALTLGLSAWRAWGAHHGRKAVAHPCELNRDEPGPECRV